MRKRQQKREKRKEDESEGSKGSVGSRESVRLGQPHWLNGLDSPRGCLPFCLSVCVCILSLYAKPLSRCLFIRREERDDQSENSADPCSASTDTTAGDRQGKKKRRQSP